MQLIQTHQADALSTARLWLKSKSNDVTTSLTSPGDIKYLQNQHSFLWLAKSTWIPKEKTDSCEVFKMSYGTRKHGDREDDSAGDLISHLFLPFPVTPANRQGTFFLLTLLCQTPGRTAKGWPAVMVGTALASPWTRGSVVLCVPSMLWCYPGRTRVQTQASRQTCNALDCTC